MTVRDAIMELCVLFSMGIWDPKVLMAGWCHLTISNIVGAIYTLRLRNKMVISVDLQGSIVMVNSPWRSQNEIYQAYRCAAGPI